MPDFVREVDEAGITGEVLRLKAGQRGLSEVLALVP
jgi:hypothetical protein